MAAIGGGALAAGGGGIALGAILTGGVGIGAATVAAGIAAKKAAEQIETKNEKILAEISGDIEKVRAASVEVDLKLTRMREFEDTVKKIDCQLNDLLDSPESRDRDNVGHAFQIAMLAKALARLLDTPVF